VLEDVVEDHVVENQPAAADEARPRSSTTFADPPVQELHAPRRPSLKKATKLVAPASTSRPSKVTSLGRGW